MKKKKNYYAYHNLHPSNQTIEPPRPAARNANHKRMSNIPHILIWPPQKSVNENEKATTFPKFMLCLHAIVTVPVWYIYHMHMYSRIYVLVPVSSSACYVLLHFFSSQRLCLSVMSTEWCICAPAWHPNNEQGARSSDSGPVRIKTTEIRERKIKSRTRRRMECLSRTNIHTLSLPSSTTRLFRGARWVQFSVVARASHKQNVCNRYSIPCVRRTILTCENVIIGKLVAKR